MSNRMREELEKRARLGITIEYEKLNNLLDSPYELKYSYERERMGEDLGAISELENANGRPLLSAIVIKAIDGVCGNVFFEMAEKLGLYDPNKKSKKQFLKEEQQKVFDYWKKH